MLNTIGLKTAVCLTASVLLGASASAAIVYDNSQQADFGNRITSDGAGTETGDIIGLAGTDRLLSEIHLEYFAGTQNLTGSGNEMAQLFIRALNGPAFPNGTPGPGDLLYSTGPFNIAAGYHTIDVTGIGGVTLPDSIAYSIVFSGIEAGETAGLLFYTPTAGSVGTNPTTLDPTSGTQTDFSIRQQAGGTWELVDYPNVTDNFGVRIVAVPEPGTWAILLGGLAMFGFVRRRKS